MKTWVFQGNPDEYADLVGYLQKEEIIWAINQEHIVPDVKIGGNVYIWKSKGKYDDLVGIVAFGKILAKPQKMPDDEPGRFINPQDMELARTNKKYRVKIKILERRFNRREGILEKDTIRREIREFPVIKMTQGTNYLLKDSQAIILSNLWNQNSK